jgi:hypothetical protein
MCRRERQAGLQITSDRASVIKVIARGTS